MDESCQGIPSSRSKIYPYPTYSLGWDASHRLLQVQIITDSKIFVMSLLSPLPPIQIYLLWFPLTPFSQRYTTQQCLGSKFVVFATFWLSGSASAKIYARTYVRTYFGCIEEIVQVASLIQLFFINNIPPPPPHILEYFFYALNNQMI